MKTIRLLNAVIGIDLGNARHVICVLDTSGEVFEQRSIPNTRASLTRLANQYPKAVVGHGSALCAEAIAYARERNFPRISLWVLVQNHRVRRFYERMEFLEDGAFKCEERPGFVLEEIRYRRRTVDCDPPDDADLSRTDSKDAL